MAVTITEKGEARMRELLMEGFLNISPKFWDEWHILQDLTFQLGKETAMSVRGFLTGRDTITGRLFRKYSESLKKAYVRTLQDLIEQGLVELKGEESVKGKDEKPFVLSLIKDKDEQRELG